MCMRKIPQYYATATVYDVPYFYAFTKVLCFQGVSLPHSFVCFSGQILLSPYFMTWLNFEGERSRSQQAVGVAKASTLALYKHY